MRSHVRRCSLSQRLNECRPNVSRLRFRIRAVESVEKWDRVWSRGGRKCRPVIVRLAVMWGATRTRYVGCVDQYRQHPSRETRYGGLGWGTVDDGPSGIGRISLEAGW